MRPLIVSEFMTLDGVVEAHGGEPTHPHSGWTMAYGVPELSDYKLNETLAAESLLLGRVTYEGFSAVAGCTNPCSPVVSCRPTR